MGKMIRGGVGRSRTVSNWKRPRRCRRSLLPELESRDGPTAEPAGGVSVDTDGTLVGVAGRETGAECELRGKSLYMWL